MMTTDDAKCMLGRQTYPIFETWSGGKQLKQIETSEGRKSILVKMSIRNDIESVLQRLIEANDIRACRMVIKISKPTIYTHPP